MMGSDNPDSIQNEAVSSAKGDKKIVSTRQMRDPLTNVFLLDQTLKIMKQVVLLIEGQHNELSKALEQLKLDLRTTMDQFTSGEFNYSTSIDATAELWKKFRRIMDISVRK